MTASDPTELASAYLMGGYELTRTSEEAWALLGSEGLQWSTLAAATQAIGRRTAAVRLLPLAEVDEREAVVACNGLARVTQASVIRDAATFVRLHDAGRSELYEPWGYLQYQCQATVYHYLDLVRVVCGIRREWAPAHSRMREQGLGLQNGAYATLGFKPEPYMAFDAFLAAARRSLDSVLGVLRARHPREGYPRSAHDFVKKAPLRHPVDLRDRICAAWDEWGRLLKAYRDCMMHHVPMAFRGSWQYVFARSNEPYEVEVVVAIPRNPETVRCVDDVDLGFPDPLDAVDYAQRVLGELIALVEWAFDQCVR
ncbi:MAG: hypothetical protein FJX75_07325 [Armatimonadetes bacterium]|nr:hypothetical protein [Armatimonadota bacterium]